MFDNYSCADGRSSRSMYISLAIHCALVMAVVAIGFTVGAIVAPRRTAIVELLAAPLPLKRARVRVPKQKTAFVAKAAAPIGLPEPAAFHAPPVAVKPAPVAAAAIAQVLLLPNEPPVAVATVPTVKRAVKVQTGGFSTASTTPAENSRGAPVATSQFGEIGIAARGAARRAVSGTEFGGGVVATAAANGRSPVQSGSFGDTGAAVAPAGGAHATISARLISAQILEKPRPAYTDEARKLEIEGEVQLEVVFGASGKVQILRVVHGLGHGLDENAALAATAIRFLPAQRDGRAVDSTAMIHIIFQLAS